jgi:hypothetical protein
VGDRYNDFQGFVDVLTYVTFWPCGCWFSCCFYVVLDDVSLQAPKRKLGKPEGKDGLSEAFFYLRLFDTGLTMFPNFTNRQAH